MSYKNIGGLCLERKSPTLGKCDYVEVDFDESSQRLRVRFYRNKAEFDSLELRVFADDVGVLSDVDVWKMKCLDLSADLHWMEEQLLEEEL